MELPYLHIDVPIWLILLAVLVSLIYLYGIWPYTFFSSLGIPGPKPLPFIGNFVDFFTKTEIENENKWVKQYGKIFGFYNGRQPVLSIHDPKVIENILIKDFAKFCNRENDVPLNHPIQLSLFFLEDDEWRSMRNAILPSFTSGKLKLYFESLMYCRGRLEEVMDKAAEDGQIEDIKKLFGNYAIEVISAIGFGLKVDAQNNAEDPLLVAVADMFKKSIPVSYLICKILPFLRPISDFIGLGIWPYKSVDFFCKTTVNILKDRKIGAKNTKDFIQLLIECKKFESKAENKLRDLTTDEICGQTILFFLAGYETTATLIAFSCYNIALYPDIQEKIYAEIMEQIGDEEITYEGLAKLKYMDQCMYETLRLFTPVYSISRVAQEDVVLGGYHIPRGTVLNLPFQHIHNNPDVYPDPLTFNPDRFAPEKRTEKKAIFLPFGAGPRMCTGNRLALLEAKLAIMTAIKKYFLTIPDSKKEIKFKPGPMLFTTDELTIQIKARNSTKKDN